MTKPAKLIAKILSYLMAPILREDPDEIYKAIVNKDKQKIYEWFVENKINKAIVTFFLIFIGLLLTHIVFLAVLHIITKKYGVRRFVRELLKPFNVQNPGEIDCLAHYLTNARILSKLYAYLAILFMGPVFEVASVLGCEVPVRKVVKSYKTLLFAATVVTMFLQSKWSKKELINYIVNILSQIGVENPRQAIDMIVESLEDLQKRLPNLVQSYRKLGMSMKHINKPEGSIPYKMVMFPVWSMKAAFHFFQAVILTSHNVITISDELTTIERAVEMLTKWTKRIDHRIIIKTLAIALMNYLSKKVLRGTSQYLLTRRYGLALFIISAIIFIALEIMIDCQTHKQIMKVLRGS